jgi:hypothetical protein
MMLYGNVNLRSHECQYVHYDVECEDGNHINIDKSIERRGELCTRQVRQEAVCTGLTGISALYFKVKQVLANIEQRQWSMCTSEFMFMLK